MSAAVSFPKASAHPPMVLNEAQKITIYHCGKIVRQLKNLMAKKVNKAYPSNTSSFFSWSFKILSSTVFSITNLIILQRQKTMLVSSRSKKWTMFLYNFEHLCRGHKRSPDWLILPYSVNSILSLPLHCWVPPRIHQENLDKNKTDAPIIHFQIFWAGSSLWSSKFLKQAWENAYMWSNCHIQCNASSFQAH